MTVNIKFQYAKLDDLYLDSKNPRLARHRTDPKLSQEEILEIMNDLGLEELAESYLESGFWGHEPLLVVREESNGKQRLVVVDGNRRLATLIYLHQAISGEQISAKWSSLVENRDVPAELFNEIPYVRINSRQDVEAFLGFHHSNTGIKGWVLDQTAEYIAKLIDEKGMNYEEVTRTIGIDISTVQCHYISYRLLLQMAACLADFSVRNVRRHFSALFWSVQTLGVQQYLGLNTSADIKDAKIPVSKNRLKALANFARWLFGNQQSPPLRIDSRNISNFGRLLENPEAVQYLENNKRARFDVAWQLAYGDEKIIQLIDEARNDLAIALRHIHRYKDSPEIQSAVERLSINTNELLNRFQLSATNSQKKVVPE